MNRRQFLTVSGIGALCGLEIVAFPGPVFGSSNFSTEVSNIDGAVLVGLWSHVACQSVSAQRCFLAGAGRYEVLQRHVAPLLLDDLVLRRRDHDEVRHLRCVEMPVILGLVAELVLFVQHAVRYDVVTFFHGGFYANTNQVEAQ